MAGGQYEWLFTCFALHSCLRTSWSVILRADLRERIDLIMGLMWVPSMVSCLHWFFFSKSVEFRNVIIIPKSAQPFFSQKIDVICMCYLAIGHIGAVQLLHFAEVLNALFEVSGSRRAAGMIQGLSIPRWITIWGEGQQVPAHLGLNHSLSTCGLWDFGKLLHHSVPHFSHL